MFRRAPGSFQYKLLIFTVHAPIKVTDLDVTLLVQMLDVYNSSKSSLTESSFSESLLPFTLNGASHLVLFDRRVNIPCPWLFLLCLPVRETETIISKRERELVGQKKGFPNVTQSESKIVLFDS